MASYCYWCHQLLPSLPEGASYVDELNHYIHDECREDRDDNNRRMEEVRRRIVGGTLDSIPEGVRRAVLDRFKASGFSRRCPCLYDEAYGFQGYEGHSLEGDEDYDARNSIDGCELCGGSGNYDPLPQLQAMHDDTAAAAWVAKELPKSAGPCDRSAFPEVGWQYDALAHHRHEKRQVPGVILYNINQMSGGVITWLEIADLFRPRRQSSLF